MATSSYCWIYTFVVCLLARSGLSVPASSVRTATTQIGSRNHAVSSLDIVPTLNLTSAVPDVGMKYLVPNTQITMFFYLGFRIDEVAMKDTIDAAMNYCDLQIQRSGDVPLPRTEDPFRDDLGYGAAIFIASVKVRDRITWGILKGITQGLWNFLVEEGRYMEAEFNVVYDKIGLVGRGTINEAAKAPNAVQ